MPIEVFNRYEHKFLLNKQQYEQILKIMDKYMEPDSYNLNHKPYTIANIYYDTEDNFLIRASLSKPVYKEKLRLRAYGVPNMDTKVFLEIKKKYKGLVNKRRTTMRLDEAYSFMNEKMLFEYKDYMNGQVIKELEHFVNLYDLSPKVYIAYDRVAYFEKDNADLRISFDQNIRTRRNDVGLENGDGGIKLLDDNTYLMEIKTSRSMPLWLAHTINDMCIRKINFSKYGAEYKNFLSSSVNEMKIIAVPALFEKVKEIKKQRKDDKYERAF